MRLTADGRDLVIRDDKSVARIPVIRGRTLDIVRTTERFELTQWCVVDGKRYEATMHLRKGATNFAMVEQVLRVFMSTGSACPACGTPGAYVGLNAVECVKPGCANYKASDLPVAFPHVCAAGRPGCTNPRPHTSADACSRLWIATMNPAQVGTAGNASSAGRLQALARGPKVSAAEMEADAVSYRRRAKVRPCGLCERLPEVEWVMDEFGTHVTSSCVTCGWVVRVPYYTVDAPLPGDADAKPLARGFYP